MKKMLSVILATLLILSAVTFAPFSVSAIDSSDYTYKVLEDNTIEITKYRGNDVDVIIPETLDGYTVTKIGEFAFEEAKAKSFTIPDTVTVIGWGAFAECENLEKIDVPDSVVSIDSWAFTQCPKLTEVSLGSSLEEIEVTAFNRSHNVKTITIDPNNKHFDSRNNCNAVIETATNTLVIGISTTVIPDTVTSIATNAFLECYSLTEINIPDSVTTIDSMAFGHCINLSKIHIGNSLTTIGYCSFLSNKKLEEINLPESLTTIDDRAFDHCQSLKEISIPAGVTTIGSEVFTNCFDLAKITVDINNRYYDSRNDCNAIIETATNNLIVGGNNTVIPDTVKTIERKSFEGRLGLNQITISDSVTKIGESAFYSCTNLKDITISASVKKIDEKAFGFVGATWAPETIEGLTIHGYNGTIAQYYANAFDFNFVSLGDAPADIDSTPQFEKGDVDGDLRITILDATRVQRHLALLENLGELFCPYGDMDGDGKLTILDATKIQIHLANMIPPEP